MTYKLTNTSINPDPYYGAVSLLLSGDGANNSTDIRDSSRNTKVVTVAGDAKISTAQSKWNGSSLYFDGTGDYLTTPYLTSAFDWWTTDFTIEMWVYASSWTNWSATSLGTLPRTVGNFDPLSAVNYWSFGPDTAGRVKLYYYNGSEQHNIYSTAVLATSQWHHIAASKDSSGVRLFINGVNNDGVFSINGTPQSSAAVPFTIAQYDGIGITGYIDDLRVTKGVARYTSNFTPPTQPFLPTFKVGADPEFYNTSLLLHGDGANGSTTIVDSSPSPKTVTAVGDAQISTAQSKFGGASIAFDGNGDYLSIPDNNDWDISGDYTVEFWARMPSQSTASYTLGYFGTIAINGASGFALGHYLGTVSLTLNGTLTASSAVLLTNTWQHIALVISGASAKVYVDGVSVISTTSATTTTSTSFIVGNYGNLDANRYFNGYIDDLRITKGVARYTSNFSPPTAPFPNF